MLPEYRNIYQVARESTGLTQEKSSELMDISVDSLRAYEGGKRIPPENIVINMSKIYNCPYLWLQHYQINTLMGKEIFSEVQIKILAEAVLTVLYKCEDLKKIRELMMKISCDGKIDSSESEAWEQIMKDVNDIVAAGIALKFAK